MFIEAEQVRLSERTRKAAEQVSEGLRLLAEQRFVVRDLERHGRPADAAKLALVSLIAAQRLSEDNHKRLLTHLNSVLASV
jgi:hypothetical protein